MTSTAYLRAYEPLSAFAPEERARWLVEQDPDGSGEVHASRRWLLRTTLPDAPTASEGAFVRRRGDELLVCPWRTRLRMLAGLLAFRGSVPQEVADAFVPEAEAQRAARELATIGDRHPEIRTHILHANWHVPLRWFAAFDETERVLTEDNEGLRVRYAASIGAARTRVARALLVLQTSGLDEGVTESLAELGTWLDSFVEEGILELDYGTVAGIFETDDLVEDRSAAEVWCCIEALEAGDVVKAGRTFATLTDRWGEVRSREVVN